MLGARCSSKPKETGNAENSISGNDGHGRRGGARPGAAALARTVLADQCEYSDNDNDDGPCVRVRNGLTHEPFKNQEMHLWRYNGPPAADHRIVLNRNDSYTCRGIPAAKPGLTGSTKIKIKRHQVRKPPS